MRPVLKCSIITALFCLASLHYNYYANYFPSQKIQTKKTHFKVSCATQIVKQQWVALQMSMAKKAGDMLHVYINDTQ